MFGFVLFEQSYWLVFAQYNPQKDPITPCIALKRGKNERTTVHEAGFDAKMATEIFFLLPSQRYWRLSHTQLLGPRQFKFVIASIQRPGVGVLEKMSAGAWQSIENRIPLLFMDCRIFPGRLSCTPAFDRQNSQ